MKRKRHPLVPPFPIRQLIANLFARYIYHFKTFMTAYFTHSWMTFLYSCISHTFSCIEKQKILQHFRKNAHSKFLVNSGSFHNPTLLVLPSYFITSMLLLIMKIKVLNCVHLFIKNFTVHDIRTRENIFLISYPTLEHF